MKHIAGTFFVLFAMCAVVHGSLRESVALFVDMSAADSIVSFTRLVSTDERYELRVQLYNRDEGTTRTETVTTRSHVIDRLLEKATRENVAIRWDAVESGPDSAIATENKTISAPRKNKIRYVIRQTLYTSYAYGPAAAFALRDELNTTAYSLLAFTGGAAGHSIFAWNRTFEDAHIYGINHLVESGFFIDYTLPVLILGADPNLFRIGSILVLPTYPLALYYGFSYGERYIDNPGRISLQIQCARNGIILGGLAMGSIFEFSPSLHNEAISRLLSGTMLLGGIAGHVGSHWYRPGETITRGVPLGITHRSIIGALIAGEVLVLIDKPNHFSPYFFIGTALGFLQGLYAYRDRYDTFERGVFNTLGMLGGTTFAGGFVLLTKQNNPKIGNSLLIVSTIGGYILTNHLTRDMQVDVTARSTEDRSRLRMDLSLLPVPDMPHDRPSRRRGERVREYTQLTWRVPGLRVQW